MTTPSASPSPHQVDALTDLVHGVWDGLDDDDRADARTRRHLLEPRPITEELDELVTSTRTPRHHHQEDRRMTITVDQAAEALAVAAASAYWDDGSLLLDLDERVLRERLAPLLATALSEPAVTSASLASAG